jgi:hypothetical protein
VALLPEICEHLTGTFYIFLMNMSTNLYWGHREAKQYFGWCCCLFYIKVGKHELPYDIWLCWKWGKYYNLLYERFLNLSPGWINTFLPTEWNSLTHPILQDTTRPLKSYYYQIHTSDTHTYVVYVVYRPVARQRPRKGKEYSPSNRRINKQPFLSNGR